MEEKRYMIYGAGKQGRAYYGFLRQKGLDPLIAGFCDRQYDVLKQIAGKQVFDYEAAKKQDVQFIVAVGNLEDRDEVYRMLEADGMGYCSIDDFAGMAGMGRAEFNREFCAAFHKDSMDEYFEGAESEEALKVFWDDTSEFRKLFDRLDLQNVIELACGRGRHVPQYMDRAGNITLVDILPENMEFCRERFYGKDHIVYYRNNGFNLGELESSAYTALFSYDAVVHFEMMDIYEYLTDIYRVLIPRGKALIHHSNNDSDYRASFSNTVHGRSFMNWQTFACLAYRAGFEIHDQKVIDWEGYRNLDCITLLQKPSAECGIKMQNP